MKIVILAPGLPNKGGAARFTWEFSEYLASQKDDVTIISLYSDKNLFKEKNRLKIIDLADKNSMTQSVKFWINLSKTRKKIRNLIKELKPALEIVTNYLLKKKDILFRLNHYSEKYETDKSKFKESVETLKIMKNFVKIYQKKSKK